MFEQHSRSILMINIRGTVDKLTKKDDQTQQLTDLSLKKKILTLLLKKKKKKSLWDLEWVEEEV